MIGLLGKANTGGGIAVVVEARAFDLEIETEFTTFVEQVPPGRTRYLLTYLDRTDIREIDGTVVTWRCASPACNLPLPTAELSTCHWRHKRGRDSLLNSHVEKHPAGQ